MLSQSLTYSNFYYNYAIFKLYDILVGGQSQNYKGSYFWGGTGPPPAPGVASPVVSSPTIFNMFDYTRS